MSPHLVLPSLLTQCAESLMTVTDAHQVPAALQMLSMKKEIKFLHFEIVKKSFGISCHNATNVCAS